MENITLKTALRLFLAALFALAVLLHLNNLVIKLETDLIEFKLYMFIMAACFYLLNTGAALGILLAKRWGSWLAYFAIPVTTFFYSISYFPIMGIFVDNSLTALLINNSLVLISVAIFHLNPSSQSSQTEESE